MGWPINQVGYPGMTSPPGAAGPEGEAGAAATIAVGTVTAVPNGTPPTVTNSGSSSSAVFDFELETGEDGLPGLDGDDAYVYIAYASDASGTDFTLTFDPDLDYIAVKHTTTAIGSPAVGDFTDLWKNYKGEKGDAGDVWTGGLDDLSDVVITSVEQGDILYRNNTGWVNEHHGDVGNVWTSGGHAANPSWAAPASGGHAIEDEGTPLTARATLNFVGAGVTVTDSAPKTIVTIPGGGGSGGGSFLVSQVFS